MLCVLNRQQTLWFSHVIYYCNTGGSESEMRTLLKKFPTCNFTLLFLKADSGIGDSLLI